MPTIAQRLDTLRGSFLVRDSAQATALCDTILVEATSLLATAPPPKRAILQDVISEMGHWKEHLPLMADDDQWNNLLGLWAVLKAQVRNL